MVARLPNGGWSAPSAIVTAGGGVGGQIGFELTDFVFILNDAHAVKTFSQQGSITLGGNVSLAAGPVGRNAEAAGAASLRSVAGIFSYSKTKGLFAGVSLEGSGIVERRDANEKMYGHRYTAAQLLSGSVASPPQAAPLMTVLNSRVFSGMGRAASNADQAMYNDVPVYDDRHDDVVWNNNNNNNNNNGGAAEFGRPSRANTWNHDSGSARTGSAAGSGGADHDDNGHVQRNRPFSMTAAPGGTGGFPAEKTGPGRPAPPKPNFASKQALLRKNEAVALFDFDADQPGDLGFKKGDVITVLKKTESDNDWW